MNTIFIVLPILTLLMFDLGLTLRPHDFQLILQRPLPVLAGVIGQIVLLPLIAWGVGTIFHLNPLFFLGIMLIACTIITLFTVPLIMAWVTASIGTGADVHLPVGNLLMQNLVLMAVPILIGVGVGMKWTSAANRIHNVLKRAAFPALILLATVFFLQHKDTIVEEFPSLGLCITVLILLAMSGGSLLSFIFRLTGAEQRTIVIEVGMQNAAQAITVACSPLVFNNETIAIPAIIYALMMNILLLIYVGCQRHIKRLS